MFAHLAEKSENGSTPKFSTKVGAGDGAGVGAGDGAGVGADDGAGVGAAPGRRNSTQMLPVE